LDHKYPWALIRPLLWEKIPLFALTALSSILTYISEQKGGALGSLEDYPAGDRFANAFVSYIVYIGKMIWPDNLAVYYPYPGLQPFWQVLGAVFIFFAVILMVIWTAKRFPYLAVGWLWYVGTLVPVIGFVQVGSHAMADRYTYIPLIGLFIMAAWGVPELLKGWRFRKEALLLASALSLSCLFMVTWTQVGYWRNSLTLFEHAFKVTDPDSEVYKNRGSAYASIGNYRQAIDDLNKAIELSPKNADALNIRAGVYVGLGSYQKANEDLNKAIELKPKYAIAYNNRAGVHVNLDNYKLAIEDCDKAIELNPEYAQAYHNRGNAYVRLGDYRRAIEDYDKALEINLNYAPAYNSRAGVYVTGGNFKRAIEDLDKAIDLNPKYAEAYNNRGNGYARLGQYKQAIEDYGTALEVNPKYAVAYNNRAAAYLSLRNYRQAVEDLKTAARLGNENAQKSLKSQGISW